MKMIILVLLPFVIQLVATAPTSYNCNVPSDLVFVLDGSDSLKASEFNATKQFVKEVLQQLAVEKQYAQVGVIVYSTFIGGTIDLGAFTTYSILQIFIDNLSQPRQGTATDIAINAMKTMFDNRPVDRQSVRKIGIVLTDGRSTSPTATIAAANTAKASGIQMFTIGYGTDVFVYELEQIATDASTTLLLTNNVGDPAFMAEFMEKLKIRICDPITTQAPTTIASLPPSTQKLVTGDVCPNCMKDINTGYKEYQGDCTRYVDVRPDANGGSIQVVKKCPFGTFWDISALTCVYSWMVTCPFDPCAAFSSGTIAMPDVCSGFWTCDKYRGNATCCPSPNQRYVQGVGCLQDFSCTTPCPDDDSNKLVQPQRCYRYAYQNDQSRYYEENHGTNITRRCAPGTWFDQNTCSCSILSGINTAPLQRSGGRVWKEPFTKGTSTNQRDRSVQIWQTLNQELLQERTILLNGKEFFNIWQAHSRPVLKDVFLMETGGDSFNLWAPKFKIGKTLKSRLRVIPRRQQEQNKVLPKFTRIPQEKLSKVTQTRHRKPANSMQQSTVLKRKKHIRVKSQKLQEHPSLIPKSVETPRKSRPKVESRRQKALSKFTEILQKESIRVTPRKQKVRSGLLPKSTATQPKRRFRVSSSKQKEKANLQPISKETIEKGRPQVTLRRQNVEESLMQRSTSTQQKRPPRVSSSIQKEKANLPPISKETMQKGRPQVTLHRQNGKASLLPRSTDIQQRRQSQVTSTKRQKEQAKTTKTQLKIHPQLKFQRRKQHPSLLQGITEPQQKIRSLISSRRQMDQARLLTRFTGILN